MWQANMILCVAIGFGCFIWAIKKTMNAERKKNK